jgi:hypothetical protein
MPNMSKVVNIVVLISALISTIQDEKPIEVEVLWLPQYWRFKAVIGNVKNNVSPGSEPPNFISLGLINPALNL